MYGGHISEAALSRSQRDPSHIPYDRFPRILKGIYEDPHAAGY